MYRKKDKGSRVVEKFMKVRETQPSGTPIFGRLPSIAFTLSGGAEGGVAHGSGCGWSGIEKSYEFSMSLGLK